MSVSPSVSLFQKLFLQLLGSYCERNRQVCVLSFSNQRMVVEIHQELNLVEMPLHLVNKVNFAFASLFRHLAELGELG
jgi:hypothetical protein